MKLSELSLNNQWSYPGTPPAHDPTQLKARMWDLGVLVLTFLQLKKKKNTGDIFPYFPGQRGADSRQHGYSGDAANV